jgi:hypothetical protein
VYSLNIKTHEIPGRFPKDNKILGIISFSHTLTLFEKSLHIFLTEFIFVHTLDKQRTVLNNVRKVCMVINIHACKRVRVYTYSYTHVYVYKHGVRSARTYKIVRLSSKVCG